MIVRELLARLGFAVDEKSHARAEDAIAGLKESALHLVEILASVEAVKHVYELVNSVAELGEQLQHTSIMLGVSTQALQELGFAAGQAGVDQGALQFGLRILSRTAYEASTGSAEAAKSFSQIGVKVTDASGKIKPVQKLLEEVSGKFAAMTDATKRTALAQKLFGRSGAELIPLLIKGGAEIEAERKEAEALGGIMDKDLIEKSEKYVQTQKKMTFAIQGVKNMIARELLPIFTKTTQAIVDWIKKNREWLSLKIHEWIDKAIRLMHGLYDVVSGAIGIFERFVDAIGPVGRALLIVAGVLLAIEAMTAAPVLAIIAMALLIGGMVDDWETFLRGGDSLLGHWIGPVDTWIAKVNEAKKAWSDFVESIADDIQNHGIFLGIGDALVAPLKSAMMKLAEFQGWMTMLPLRIIEGWMHLSPEDREGFSKSSQERARYRKYDRQ
jgi:hypothetical protein